MFSGLASVILTATHLAMLIAALWAFVHCLRARPDAFPAIGRSSKGLWLALTGGATLVALAGFSAMTMFGIAAIVISAVYLLDIRPRIREITGGRCQVLRRAPAVTRPGPSPSRDSDYLPWLATAAAAAAAASGSRYSPPGTVGCRSSSSR